MSRTRSAGSTARWLGRTAKRLGAPRILGGPAREPVDVAIRPRVGARRGLPWPARRGIQSYPGVDGAARTPLRHRPLGRKAPAGMPFPSDAPDRIRAKLDAGD